MATNRPHVCCQLKTPSTKPTSPLRHLASCGSLLCHSKKTLVRILHPSMKTLPTRAQTRVFCAIEHLVNCVVSNMRRNVTQIANPASTRLACVFCAIKHFAICVGSRNNRSNVNPRKTKLDPPLTCAPSNMSSQKFDSRFFRHQTSRELCVASRIN